MFAIKRIRPSNLVILAALPFIIYLFATSHDYQRSLIAIIGVEPASGGLFGDFLTVLWPLLLGTAMPVLVWCGWPAGPQRAQLLLITALGGVAGLLYVAFAADLSVLLGSIAANGVDPYTSTLLVKGELPRRLTPEATQWVVSVAGIGFKILAAMVLLLTAAALPAILQGRAARVTQLALRGLFLAYGLPLAYLIFATHLGFATGLFTTLRAASFAYLIACALGLLWAGLLRLAPKRHTIAIFAALCAGLALGAAYFMLQPHTTFALVGSFDKKVAIIKGTPKSLVDNVRFGTFDGGPGHEIGVRSAATVDDALRLMADGQEVTGALMPLERVPAGVPELWRVSFLQDEWRNPGIGLMLLATVLGLLTFGAFLHDRHPLAVGAEFFVDTVRGIPMLVIILYIGLPVSGAVKDATGGAIDMSNVARGVIAMAIGYSAYLAEIFRAGIEAVPRGQLEAGRSLGLNRWQLARFIILPQALRVVIPPLGNEFIAIMKDTSLLSILSVRDVTQRMREFQSASFLPFAPFNATAILYVILALAAASGIKWIERKYDVKSH